MATFSARKGDHMDEKIKTSMTVASFKLDLLDRLASQKKRSRNFLIEQAIDELLIREFAHQQTLRTLYSENRGDVLPTIGISENIRAWGEQ